MSYNDKAIESMLIKAGQKLDSAKDDLKSNRLDSYISNLYYSIFQTILALLIKEGKSFKKHTQVRGYVNRDLAQKGLISKQNARTFNLLMDLRSDADYTTEIYMDKDKAESLLIEVLDFNSKVKDLLDKSR